MSHTPTYQSDSSEGPRTTDDEADEYTTEERAEMVKKEQLSKLHRMQKAKRQWKKKHMAMIPMLRHKCKGIIVEIFYKIPEFMVFEGNHFIFRGIKFDVKLLKPYLYITWNEDNEGYQLKILFNCFMMKAMEFNDTYRAHYATYNQIGNYWYNARSLKKDMLNKVHIIKLDYCYAVIGMLLNAISGPRPINIQRYKDENEIDDEEFIAI